MLRRVSIDDERALKLLLERGKTIVVKGSWTRSQQTVRIFYRKYFVGVGFVSLIGFIRLSYENGEPMSFKYLDGRITTYEKFLEEMGEMAEVVKKRVRELKSSPLYVGEVIMYRPYVSKVLKSVLKSIAKS